MNKKLVFAPSAMKGRISFSVDSLLSQKTIENLSTTAKDAGSVPGFTELEQDQPDYTSDSNEENIEACGFYLFISNEYIFQINVIIIPFRMEKR